MNSQLIDGNNKKKNKVIAYDFQTLMAVMDFEIQPNSLVLRDLLRIKWPS